MSKLLKGLLPSVSCSWFKFLFESPSLITTQSTFTCSKLTIETLQQGVKYIQSNNKGITKRRQWVNLGYLQIPFYWTKTYGRYSVIVNPISVWNHVQSCIRNITFHQLKTSKLIVGPPPSKKNFLFVLLKAI